MKLISCSPLVQWTVIEGALANIAQTTVDFIESYWTTILDSKPLTIYPDGNPYDLQPDQLPAILADGAFAGTVEVPTFDKELYAAYASAPINGLWNQDKVIIIKMTDQSIGGDAGSACDKFPEMTYCDQATGTAYVFVRWIWSFAVEAVGAVIGAGMQALDESGWHVTGAYAVGEGNADRLQEYGLSLEIIAKSAERLQRGYGFQTAQTSQQTIDAILEDPGSITIDKAVSFNLPVCDLEAILDGKSIEPVSR